MWELHIRIYMEGFPVDARSSGAVVLREEGSFRLVQKARISGLDNPDFVIERRGPLDAMGQQAWLFVSPEDVEAHQWLIYTLGDLIRAAQSTDRQRG